MELVLVKLLDGRSECWDIEGARHWDFRPALWRTVDSYAGHVWVCERLCESDGRYLFHEGPSDSVIRHYRQITPDEALNTLVRCGRGDEISEPLRVLLDQEMGAVADVSDGEASPSRESNEARLGAPNLTSEGTEQGSRAVTDGRKDRPSCNEERDAWMYDEYVAGTPLAEIVEQSKLRSTGTEWQALDNPSAVNMAMDRAWKRWGIPKPKHGQKINHRRGVGEPT